MNNVKVVKKQVRMISKYHNHTLQTNLQHCEEETQNPRQRIKTTTTMADTIEKPVDSGNTCFDISVNTVQIGKLFEADTLENDSNMPMV